MSVALYMDVHVPRAIAEGLRLRGVDVLTAQEDQAGEREDPQLLRRATELDRILVTQDADFLGIAKEFARNGWSFSGILFAHQLRTTAGQLVADLEMIAKAGEPADFAGRIEHLPLR